MRGVDPYIRVPDGQYRATLVRIETGIVYGQRRLFGYFQITEEGPHQGKTLVRFWNEPRGNFLPRSHNLYRDFVTLIGRRPPSSGLKPEDFLKGCEILVQVVTVKKGSDGRRMRIQPEDCWYSKIERPIRITAGCPPCGLPGGTR